MFLFLFILKKRKKESFVVEKQRLGMREWVGVRFLC